ncbi:MAG: phosphohydrolase [Burkholderiales bacterium PBB4]|nr:MAG: phosphohydrolase [Burkholderiales bacterium PBB4]
MHIARLHSCLDFLRAAEALKHTLRSGHTSNGRPESTAEHTWRLCLMAMVFQHEFASLDFAKVLKLCVIHDLGEAISGDIPAIAQHAMPDKSAKERADLVTLMQALPSDIAAEFLTLWDDYENRSSDEARMVKGLDKLETILQHNQGLNPVDFDYAFNLGYGQQYMDSHPLLRSLRTLLDADTQRLHDAQVLTAPP